MIKILKRIVNPLTLLTPLVYRLAFLLQERQDLIRFLQQLASNRVIGRKELGIIEGTLKISTMQVREIMIPRAQITAVQEEDDLATFLPQLIKSSHSRFPILNKEDKVIGILLAKDLIPHIKKKKNINLDELKRPAILIPESKRVNVLLDEFRNKRIHMAIVIDEHGLTAGLVTIEDVIEEIVGEIEDEHDVRKNPSIAKIPFNTNTYRVKGDTSLVDFNSFFSSNLSHQETETISGLLVRKLQKLPAKGETIELENMIFVITKRDERRIQELKVSLNK